MAARPPDRTNSAGISGSRESEFGSSRRLGGRMAVAVRAAGLASPGAGSERVVDNALDGAGAAAAFGAAAEAAIELLGATRKVVC